MARFELELIKNSQLNVENFKVLFDQVIWQRVPRKLSVNHADFFYLAKYEDDDRRIVIKVRPSMRMAVEETFKDLTTNGDKPDSKYRGKLCDFGSSVEVLIDDQMLDRIKAVAQEPQRISTQRVTW